MDTMGKWYMFFIIFYGAWSYIQILAAGRHQAGNYLAGASRTLRWSSLHKKRHQTIRFTSVSISFSGLPFQNKSSWDTIISKALPSVQEYALRAWSRYTLSRRQRPSSWKRIRPWMKPHSSLMSSSKTGWRENSPSAFTEPRTWSSLHGRNGSTYASSNFPLETSTPVLAMPEASASKTYSSLNPPML